MFPTFEISLEGLDLNKEIKENEQNKDNKCSTKAFFRKGI